MNVSRLFNEFFKSEKTSGLLLLFCTLFSLIITNSVFGENYHNFWQINFNGHSLEHWINDGLMTIFFLLIGLELEREIYIGELSNFKDALLPIFAAIGGMIIPAGIYMFFNYDDIYKDGAGIPMATDIAFALGILSLLGNKIPSSLKIFLTALAVIDDLGAILVIALFYTKNLVISNLLISLGIFVLLYCLGKFGKVKSIILYLIGGIFMWYFMLNSGVHATITGVLLAFAIPFGGNNESSTSYKVQHFLHMPVAYIILPIFALANTSIFIQSSFTDLFRFNYCIGIALGLIVGKPIGIFIFSYLGTRFKLCSLPKDINWNMLIGVGFLGGIGFTMSIFITLLAFSDANIINNSKLIIMISSLIAGILGYLYLQKQIKKSV